MDPLVQILMDDTRKCMYIYLVFNQAMFQHYHREKAIKLQIYLTRIQESQILKFRLLHKAA